MVAFALHFVAATGVVKGRAIGGGDMNEHVRRGNQAVVSGDRDLAILEYYEALEDDDPLVQRIAKNRLAELVPDAVFGSTSSRRYHRVRCSATPRIWRNHTVRFKDRHEAEAAGYVGCLVCQPPKTIVKKPLG